MNRQGGAARLQALIAVQSLAEHVSHEVINGNVVRIASLRNGIIALNLLLAAAGIAIGILASRRVTRPLTELADAMQDFGERKEGGELVFSSGGKEMRLLTHAFNRMISDREKAEKELKERFAYEHLLLALSSSAIKQDDLNRFQSECLLSLAETSDVSRVYVFEHRHETDTMDNTYEWVAPGIPAEKENLQGVPVSEFPWWMERLKNHEIIIHRDIEKIAGEAERAVLRSKDIKSILVVPLFVAGEYYGFMGFDDCRTLRAWPQADVDILLSASRIVTGKIESARAEEALRESARVLLESQSVAQIGSYVFDIQAGVWKSSPVLDSIFGIGEDYERSAENWHAILHPDDRSCVVDYFAHDVLEKGGRFNREYRILRHDNGIERWVLSLGELEFDAEGEPQRLVGTIQDITVRKQAEHKSQEETSLLATLLSNTGDAVAAMDENYTILFMNDKITRIFGDKTGGKCYREFCGLEAPCGVNCAVDEVIKKRMSRFEYTHDAIDDVRSGRIVGQTAELLLQRGRIMQTVAHPFFYGGNRWSWKS